MTTSDPSTREGPNGQRLCTAHTSAGDPCKGLAMQGQNVCRVHGGSTRHAKDKARLRMFDLVDPSITQLGRLIATTQDENVLLRAINTILDRTGYARGYEVTLQDARDLLAEKLAEHDTGDTE